MNLRSRESDGSTGLNELRDHGHLKGRKGEDQRRQLRSSSSERKGSTNLSSVDVGERSRWPSSSGDDSQSSSSLRRKEEETSVSESRERDEKGEFRSFVAVLHRPSRLG